VSDASPAGASPPRVNSLRLVGPGVAGSGSESAARARITLPLGAKLAADALAYAVALGPGDVTDVATVTRALPDPDSLPPGTLLLVLPAVVGAPSLTGRLLAAMGRGPTASRALRATALVARGYVRVAAGVDRETRSDLVWGYAPPTGPC
jgi:hypothetical protein